MNSKFKLNLLTLTDILILFTCIFDAYSKLPVDTLSSISTIASILCISIISYDLICNPFNIKEYIISLILLITTLISTYIGGSVKLLQMTILILAFKDINIEKYIARDVIIRIVLTLALIYLTYKNNSYTFVPFEETRIRYALGFGHPNTLGIMLAIIGIEFLYLFRNKRSYISYIVCAVIIIFNYRVSDSRTSIIVSLFGLLCFILMRFKINIFKNKVIQIIVENLFVILLVFSVIVCYMYGNGSGLAIKLNGLLSDRLVLAYNYLKEYGIHLFGSSISSKTLLQSGFYAYTLDMGFIYILVRFGLISTLVYAFVYNRAIHYLFKKNKYYEVLVILSFLVYGTMETGIFKWEFFSIGGILGLWLYDKDYKEEKAYSLHTNIISTSITALIIIILCWFTLYNSTPTYLSDGLIAIKDQYDLLIKYWNNFISHGFSTYDFSIGLGINTYTVIGQNFFSPFNTVLIILNLFNSSLSYVYYFMIRYACCGLFASLWLSKLSNKRNHIVIGSLLVSLSGIILSYYQSNFIDIYCLLPLVLFFIEKYIKDNKVVGLVISLIIISITNVSYLIPILLFLSLYALIRMFTEDKDVKDIINFFIVFGLSIGSVLFVLVPCLRVISVDNTNTSIFTLLKSLFTPISDNNVSLYSSIGSLILLPTLLMFKDKKIMSLLSLGLLISFILSLILAKFYGDACYFILTINYVYILIELFDNYNNSKFNNCLIGYICIGLLSLITLTGLSNLETIEIYYLSFIGIIFISSAIFLKSLKTSSLIFLIIFELIISTNITITSNKDNVLDIDFNKVSLITNTIAKNDNGIYRAINVDNGIEYIESDNNKDTINDFKLNTDYTSELIDLIHNGQPDNMYKGYKKNYLSYFNIIGTKYLYFNEETKKEEDNSFTPEIMSDPYSLALYNENVVENGTYIIRYASDDNYVMGVNDEGNVELQLYNSEASQMWRVSHDDNGFMTLTNLKSSKVLDLLNGNVENGTNIEEYDNNGQLSQKWIAVNRENGIEIVSSINVYKCLNVDGSNIAIFDYLENSTNQEWLFTKQDEDSASNIPSYYKKVDGKDYYINEYYIELGYINNKTINANYLLDLDEYTKEEVLREYVALEGESNTLYSLIDEPLAISDYYYESPFEYTFEEPISNTTLVIMNGIPVVDVELYYDDNLIKTQHFYQYNFCNVEIGENEYVNRIVISFTDVDNTGYGIRLYTMKPEEEVERELYNKRILNSFYNIDYKGDYISAYIDASSDNSLVYTYIPYDDNWIITVDGNKVDKLIANYGLTAFRVDSGSHKVEFTYKYSNGLLKVISGASFIALVVFIVLRKNYKY